MIGWLENVWEVRMFDIVYAYKGCWFLSAYNQLSNSFSNQDQQPQLFEQILIVKKCYIISSHQFLIFISMQKEPIQNFNPNSVIKLHSGNQIPILGYGTYELKGNDCLQGLQHALKIGYKHIDTASIYRNQTQIAQVLKKLKINRSQLFITSKIAPTQQGYQQAKQACLTIIEKLQCGYLDLILIHWPGISKLKVDDVKNAQIRLQTWKALTELKKQGRVKDIGVSNFMKRHLEHLIKNSPELPVINQIEAHPMLWQQDTINFCQQKNIAIQAYSPLARGFEEFMKNKDLKKMSQKYNKSIAQISLRYLMQKGMIILPKSKNQNRIKENMEIFDFQIKPEDIILIDTLHKHKLRTCWDPEQIKY